MSHVLHLELCRDPRLVGGKAINLARLLAAGLPVPTGFAITTDAYRAAAHDGIPTALPDEVREAIATAYAAMGSPVVAVRSSATAEDLAGASMAGQYETVLNVHGIDAVCAAVLRCWRSIDTPRVRAYLTEQRIDIAQVAMAVAVQRLVPSAAAGVLFTVNPRSGDDGEMLIESSWGLGEAVVGALVQPDTLVVDRVTGAVRHAVIADKRTEIVPGTHGESAVPEERRHIPSLDAAQIDELRQLGLRVEALYGAPQDLEWAIAGGRLFLLQSRAITTLAAVPERLARSERSALAAELAAGRGPWVRHNICETLPHPTPLTWSVIDRFMSGAGGFGTLYRAAGFDPAPDGVLRLIAGRPYQDLARSAGLFWAGYPFAYDLDRLRNDPGAAQDPPSIPNGTPSELADANRRLVTIGTGITTLADDLDRQLETTIIPAFRAWVTEESARDLAALDNEQLLALWRDSDARVMGDFAAQSLLPSVVCADAMARLRSQLEPWCWDEEPSAVAERLAASTTADSTVRSTTGLRALARGELTRSAWLAEYGHRAPSEFDLATPRWTERPDDLAAIAAPLREAPDPLQLHRERVARAAAETETITARMDATSAAALLATLAVLQRYLRFREDGKHELMRGYAVLRRLALEAGRRLGISADVFHLDESELTSALRSGFAPLPLIAQRRLRRQAESGLYPAAFIAASDLPELGRPPVLAGGDCMAAFAIASGSGRGPARIVQQPDTAGELGKGYVLVCPSTDPSWTPLFVNAAALVLERGGALSHGAVVARELGIPAVVLDGATRILKDGETVAVDGARGLVMRGDAQPASGPTESVPTPTSGPIPRSQLPPPPGPGEARSARWRNVGLLLWGIVLAAAFWPGVWSTSHVYQPIIAALDAVLWPLLRSIGGPLTVTVLAGGMAVLCMLLQRLLTDNHRLVIARDRAAALRTTAMALPAEDPRRAELLAAASPVQWRILGASMVPVGLLLGPMIFGVFWLTDRIEVQANPPGTPVQLIAEIDGEHKTPITVSGEGLTVEEAITPATQALPPIRATLIDLQRSWTRSSNLASQPWELQAAGRAARTATLADLAAYLEQPMPNRELFWRIATPERSGRFDVTLKAADGGELARIPLVLGADVAPQQTELVTRRGQVDKLLPVIRPAAGPVKRIVVLYQNAQATASPPPFLRPFAWAGWNWDLGWIGFYIAIYVPAMLLAKRLLRVA